MYDIKQIIIYKWLWLKINKKIWCGQPYRIACVGSLLVHFDCTFIYQIYRHTQVIYTHSQVSLRSSIPKNNDIYVIPNFYKYTRKVKAINIYIYMVTGF